MGWLDDAQRAASNAASTATGRNITAAQKIAAEAVDSAKGAADEAGARIQQACDAAAKTIQDAVQDARQRMEVAAKDANDRLTSLLDQSGISDTAMGSVNGVKFYTPVDGATLVDVAVSRRENPIVVDLLDLEAIKVFSALMAVAKNRARDQFLGKYIKALEDAAKVAKQAPRELRSLPGADDAILVALLGLSAEQIMAVATCINSAGAAVASGTLTASVAVFIILLGIAVIYAIHEGYTIEKVELAWQTAKPALSLRLIKG